MIDKQRVAIVTGGGQGIGKAIARKFLEHHITVVAAERDREAGRETVKQLSPLGEISWIETDVASEASVKNLLKKTRAQFGRLDILVNNAGLSSFRPLQTGSLRDWNRVIGANLTGAFLCAKHAAPLLTKSKGVIVNIASTRALQSEPGTEAYSASKGGIVALTHALAMSLGPDVRVNCISPGWIDVSDWKKNSVREPAVLSKQDHEQHPAGRVGVPNDVASLALFLCEPENSFMTGGNIVVDGGMSRKMVYVE